MNHINFEGLGLSLDINRVAIDFGNVKIYWYAIMIITGIVTAILLCKKDDGKYGIKFEDILELAVFLIPISIIFARIYFVLFKLDYYTKNPLQIFNIQDGGIAIYGGIIGAIITIAIFAKIKKIKILDLLDYLAPFLAIGQAIGRWGNFFNIEAHGTETTSLFRMGIMENGSYIQVHPTFLYESICTFLIFIFLYLRRNKRKYKGEITCWYFFLYGIARAIIEGFRTDSLMLGSIRISQLLSIILIVVFGSILILKKGKKERKTYILGAIFLGLDQITKYLMINKNINVIPSVLKFTYTENQGAAFGIGSRYIVLVLSILIILGIIIYLVKENKKIQNYIPFALILSGSIGNLIDRICRGYVIDFIDVNLFNFPHFNIADICITTGIFYLIIFEVIKIIKKK